MNILIYLTAFCWIALGLFFLKKFAHVLQSERYHTDGYFRWVTGGGGVRLFCPEKSDALFHVAAILAALSVLITPFSIAPGLALLSTGAVYWMAVDIRRKCAPKKDFTVTARIKRIFTFVIILEIVYLWIMSGFVGGRGLVAGTVFLAYLQPFFLAVGNLLALPLEKFFQAGFIRQAKQKLSGRKVIAVTGSYGKTGTKEAIAHMLEGSFPLLKTPGSYNTPMGLCRVINEKMEPHHELFITEMGATRRGDIAELCGFVTPSISIITSIGTAHLETFGSEENVALAKFELADALPADGLLVYNGDYGKARELAETVQRKAVTYGFEKGVEYRPVNISSGRDGSTFDLATPDGAVEGFKTELLGRLNIINITAAFAVGRILGIPAEKLKTSAESIPPVTARMELISRPGSYLIINDGYNSNPVGAASAVETLSYFRGFRKILVTPGIVELGALHEQLNYEFGKTAAGYCDAVYLINERRTAPLRKGLMDGGMKPENIEIFSALAQARDMLDRTADEKTVVLFENDLPDHMEMF